MTDFIRINGGQRVKMNMCEPKVDEVQTISIGGWGREAISLLVIVIG